MTFDPMETIMSIGHHRMTAARTLAVAALLSLGALGCRTTQTPLIGGEEARWTAGHQFDHVVVIVLENRDYAEVVNDPYMRTLEQRGVLQAQDGGEGVREALAQVAEVLRLQDAVGQRVQGVVPRELTWRRHRVCR